ncbi:hypothetical protein [Streptomyces sp. NPDC046909]|uniref:hypothetical protein n=1 Tax=Streptomyces sp. NPDC046909 TaxID=3155617 RepID=UPI0034057C08
MHTVDVATVTLNAFRLDGIPLFTTKTTDEVPNDGMVRFHLVGTTEEFGRLKFFVSPSGDAAEYEQRACCKISEGTFSGTVLPGSANYPVTCNAHRAFHHRVRSRPGPGGHRRGRPDPA